MTTPQQDHQQHLSSKQSLSKSFKLESGLEIIFSLDPYILQLRSAFGTSHSSTTTRTNALIRLSIDGMKGFGEVGLPPKKPLCYLADYEDIHTYFEGYLTTLEKLISVRYENGKKVCTYQPFANLPDKYFAGIRADESQRENSLRLLLQALDECALNKESFARAAKSGIEAAIFDLWCKFLSINLYELLQIQPQNKFYFYTASLNDDIEKIVENAKFGLRYTPYLKIKLDADLTKAATILARLHKLFEPVGIYKWSVDANSAWNPEQTKRFLRIVAPYKDVVYMVEQPFPVDFLHQSESELQKWAELKAEYGREGLLLFADESCSTEADVTKLKPYCHGVNIKLEKTGGIRDNIRAIVAAKKEGMKVWLGTMVGSVLSSSIPAHMLPLADIGGDLDGALLTDSNSQLFEGGFTPNGDGLVRLTHQHHNHQHKDAPPVFGIGVREKEK